MLSGVYNKSEEIDMEQERHELQKYIVDL